MNVNREIRASQVVAGALAMGVLMFGVITCVVVGGEFADEPGILTWMALGFALVELGMRAVIPGISAKGAIQKQRGYLEGDEDTTRVRLAGVYRIQMIVGMALVEGAAFFCLIAHIAEKHIYSLGAATVLLVINLSSFPTRFRVENWITDQLETLKFNQ